MTSQKRALVISDLSCMGRCSLTAALPILSAAGIETCVLPTAILSTQTGGVEGYTCRDLADEFAPIVRHWTQLSVRFDAIYTGFLGSRGQIGMVSEIREKFREAGVLTLADPSMADAGELYGLFDESFAADMTRLCAGADIITPNLTEAAIMTGRDPKRTDFSPSERHKMLRELGKLGPEKVVVTGITLEKGVTGAMWYDRKSGQAGEYGCAAIPGRYHGTGDVFASALLGGLLGGMPLPDAVRLAVDFTSRAVERTFISGADVRFGVCFEPGLAEYGEKAAAVSTRDRRNRR